MSIGEAVARITFFVNRLGFLGMLILASCQAFSPGDGVATIDADLTLFALEAMRCGALPRLNGSWSPKRLKRLAPASRACRR